MFYTLQGKILLVLRSFTSSYTLNQITDIGRRFILSRTGKRGKTNLGRTNIEAIQIKTYTLPELFNIYMFAKEAQLKVY